MNDQARPRPTFTGAAADLQRRELLEHYARKDPTAFFQIDVFVDQDPEDDLMLPDSDGDALSGGARCELMTGNYAVRVLITAGATQKQVLRGLKKARAWVKRDYAHMDAEASRVMEYASRAIDCPRCGPRPDGMHDRLCQYPDGRPTELTADEVRRVLQLMHTLQTIENGLPF